MPLKSLNFFHSASKDKLRDIATHTFLKRHYFDLIGFEALKLCPPAATTSGEDQITETGRP